MEKILVDNTTTKDYFDEFVVNGYNQDFQSCPETLKSEVKTYFEAIELANGKKLSDLNIEKFEKYWKYIEEKFDCVGWCQTTYTHNSELTENVEKEGMFIKYLFSGINRGQPKHTGCLNKMIDYIRPRLLAIGLVEFFASLVMILTWILVICILCSKSAS